MTPDFDPFDPESEQLQAGVEQTEEQKKAKEARGLLERRQLAYKRIFAGQHIDDINIVIEDLKRFCRGDSTPFDIDPRVHALLCGRHEVYMRLTDHLHLTVDQLVLKYTARRDDT